MASAVPKSRCPRARLQPKSKDWSCHSTKLSAFWTARRLRKSSWCQTGSSRSLSRLKPIALVAALIFGAAVLGACSFQPVYSGRLADSPRLDLAYASPNSRLDQIIYQDLAFRLGETEGETAPLVTVSVSNGTTEPFLSATANPNKPREATVTAVLTITPRDGL